MVNIPAKALAIGGGVATVAGGGITYLVISNKQDTPTKQITPITKLTKAKKIKSLLGARKRLLRKESGDNNNWKQRWTSFKQAYSAKDPSEIHASWRFNNWGASKLLDDVQEEFQNKCINNSEDNVEQDTDPRVTAIKTYCTTDQ
ncbi:hypothetical protein A6V39_01170 [Candidatus Mycoplasma haematobovis]|uniref:Uncharacterized protein n=1 Tax=Candidatus Mycoplasma haematobovis TaxID=432608 RepID=A0A1A9QEV3_9MOLU|nr:hypothetical protein [Candidatus Mycoplasma haematobovis]OAL10664.1 hypothetical protein A6V39_01170 [Candidatus Mycoplasma haematobovis]